jgi:hypothetical protein
MCSTGVSPQSGKRCHDARDVPVANRTDLDGCFYDGGLRGFDKSRRKIKEVEVE